MKRRFIRSRREVLPAKLKHLTIQMGVVGIGYQKAADAAGIGGIGTHSLRRTYRSWLDLSERRSSSKS